MGTVSVHHSDTMRDFKKTCSRSSKIENLHSKYNGKSDMAKVQTSMQIKSVLKRNVTFYLENQSLCLAILFVKFCSEYAHFVHCKKVSQIRTLKIVTRLSHGQPCWNFWLSVKVFGCPYLEQGKWDRVS